MKNNILIVDTNTLEKTKKIMDKCYEELVTMINTYKKMIDDSKSVYDTESATIYRKIADGYAELILKYINNDFKPYIDGMDDIKNAYIVEYSAISKSIQGGNK